MRRCSGRDETTRDLEKQGVKANLVHAFKFFSDQIILRTHECSTDSSWPAKENGGSKASDGLRRLTKVSLALPFRPGVLGTGRT
jgi:hypothetical protein